MILPDQKWLTNPTISYRITVEQMMKTICNCQNSYFRSHIFNVLQSRSLPPLRWEMNCDGTLPSENQAMAMVEHIISWVTGIIGAGTALRAWVNLVGCYY